MTQLSRITGLRAVMSVPDLATMNELSRIEDLLETRGNAPVALRSLRGLVTADNGLKRAWELGVRAFKGTRYEYEPTADVKRRLAEGREAIKDGDRRGALRIAARLVSSDPNLKQGWELGLSAHKS
jgi:hypothetical protein